jgi:hypothetical protein
MYKKKHSLQSHGIENLKSYNNFFPPLLSFQTEAGSSSKLLAPFTTSTHCNLCNDVMTTKYTDFYEYLKSYTTHSLVN